MSLSTPTLIDRVRGKSDLTLALPVYITMLGLIIMPLGYLIYAALQTDSPGSPTTEFTWDNITTVATTSSYWAALRNSLWLGFLVACSPSRSACRWHGSWAEPTFHSAGALGPRSLPIFLSPFAGVIAWVLLGSEKSGLINGG